MMAKVNVSTYGFILFNILELKKIYGKHVSQKNTYYHYMFIELNYTQIRLLVVVMVHVAVEAAVDFS